MRTQALLAHDSNQGRSYGEGLVTLAGVEIAKVGTWPASSGEVTITKADLAAAVAAAPDLPPIPLKFGHTDSRFDGDPAFGWVENLRVVRRGEVLVGDLVGVPAWLAKAMPISYPHRSIEAFSKFESTGKRYRFVVSALSMLGATPPAIHDLNSLKDILERTN